MARRTMAAKDWVPILNGALAELRKHVDGSGNGVFTLDEVLGGTVYLRQKNTISRHLTELGYLRTIKKQPGGKWLWYVDVKKRRITLADVKRARDKSSRRRLAEAGVRVSQPKPAKTAKSVTKQPAPKSGSSAKPRSGSIVTPPEDVVPVDVPSPVLIDTDHVSQLKAADGRIAALVRVVALLEAEVAGLSSTNSELVSELSALRDHLGDSVNEQISAAADEVIGKYLS